jgi:hypothetical protein
MKEKDGSESSKTEKATLAVDGSGGDHREENVD